jgi:hypothetical protein
MTTISTLALSTGIVELGPEGTTRSSPMEQKATFGWPTTHSAPTIMNPGLKLLQAAIRDRTFTEFERQIAVRRLNGVQQLPVGKSTT